MSKIITKLTTPKFAKYQTLDVCGLANLDKFKALVIEALSLPDNWDKYFSIDYYNSHLSVRSKRNSRWTFRKFKCDGREAAITKEQVEAILEHISAIDKSDKQRMANGEATIWGSRILSSIFPSLPARFLAHYSIEKAGITISMIERPIKRDIIAQALLG